MKCILNTTLFFALLPLLFWACKDDEPASDNRSQVIENYGDIVLANYQDAYTKAQELDAALKTLVSSPSQNTMEAARQAWIDSRPSYLQTEAFRFYAGPIDDDEGPEGSLNAWPMDEAYLDYVQGDDNAGIINRTDLFPELTEELLRDLNERDGETNITTGYHAIEFLLWGQDLNQSPSSAGMRPFTDYSTAANAERRGQYLLLVSNILLEDLQYLIDAWQPGQNNFRKSFEADPTVAMRKILNGLKELSGGELGGERTEVAYTTRDQEDEHSCFSDNTHNDHIYDMQGIINVYRGSYTRIDGSVVSGASLADFIQKADVERDANIQAQLDLCMQNLQAILPPFDQAINNESERQKLRKAIDDLLVLADEFLFALDLL